METDEKFEEIYKKIVDATEEELKYNKENEIAHIKKLVVRIPLTIVAVFFIIRFLGISNVTVFYCFAEITLIGSVVYFYFKNYDKKREKILGYKEKIFGIMIKEFGEQLEYSPKSRNCFFSLQRRRILWLL